MNVMLINYLFMIFRQINKSINKAIAI